MYTYNNETSDLAVKDFCATVFMWIISRQIIFLSTVPVTPIWRYVLKHAFCVLLQPYAKMLI